MSIDTSVTMTRYEVPRGRISLWVREMSTLEMTLFVSAAGLLLIGKHAAQFKEYLAKDHEV